MNWGVISLVMAGCCVQCYSSTNFLGQLLWYREPLRWNRIPRDLEGNFYGFNYTTCNCVGFHRPHISVYSLCYFRHDYFE